MTLLELLVKELPKRGGWPEEAGKVVQDYYCGTIKFAKKKDNISVAGMGDEGIWQGDWSFGCRSDFDFHVVSDDWNSSVVTREQYEAAIAAQQSAWDGEGLPPVGTECAREVPRGWSRCRINYVSSSLIVYQMLDCGNEYSSAPLAFKFRPIRTEADRKREDAAAAICVAGGGLPFGTGLKVEGSKHVVGQIWFDVYDAIAAGKIPGVEIKK